MHENVTKLIEDFGKENMTRPMIDFTQEADATW